MTSTVTKKPIISADSHIMEPPETYIGHIDKKYKDTAPRVVWDEKRGDTYVIDGMKDTIPMGLVAAAGRKAEELAGLAARAKFADLHRGGWDPEARMADQDRDGVAAEVIYPTRRHDALQSSRRGLQESLLRRLQPVDRGVLRPASGPPDRAAARPRCASPEEGIEDLDRIKAMGFAA